MRSVSRYPELHWLVVLPQNLPWVWHLYATMLSLKHSSAGNLKHWSTQNAYFNPLTSLLSTTKNQIASHRSHREWKIWRAKTAMKNWRPKEIQVATALQDVDTPPENDKNDNYDNNGDDRLDVVRCGQILCPPHWHQMKHSPAQRSNATSNSFSLSDLHGKIWKDGQRQDWKLKRSVESLRCCFILLRLQPFCPLSASVCSPPPKTRGRSTSSISPDAVADH